MSVVCLLLSVMMPGTAEQEYSSVNDLLRGWDLAVPANQDHCFIASGYADRDELLKQVVAGLNLEIVRTDEGTLTLKDTPQRIEADLKRLAYRAELLRSSLKALPDYSSINQDVLADKAVAKLIALAPNKPISAISGLSLPVDVLLARIVRKLKPQDLAKLEVGVHVFASPATSTQRKLLLDQPDISWMSGFAKRIRERLNPVADRLDPDVLSAVADQLPRTEQLTKTVLTIFNTPSRVRFTVFLYDPQGKEQASAFREIDLDDRSSIDPDNSSMPGAFTSRAQIVSNPFLDILSSVSTRGPFPYHRASSTVDRDRLLAELTTPRLYMEEILREAISELTRSTKQPYLFFLPQESLALAGKHVRNGYFNVSLWLAECLARGVVSVQRNRDHLVVAPGHFNGAPLRATSNAALRKLVGQSLANQRILPLDHAKMFHEVSQLWEAGPLHHLVVAGLQYCSIPLDGAIPPAPVHALLGSLSDDEIRTLTSTGSVRISREAKAREHYLQSMFELYPGSTRSQRGIGYLQSRWSEVEAQGGARDVRIVQTAIDEKWLQLIDSPQSPPMSPEAFGYWLFQNGVAVNPDYPILLVSGSVRRLSVYIRNDIAFLDTSHFQSKGEPPQKVQRIPDDVLASINSGYEQAMEEKKAAKARELSRINP